MAVFTGSQAYVRAMLAGDWNSGDLKGYIGDDFELSLKGKAIGYDPEYLIEADLPGMQGLNLLAAKQRASMVENSSSTAIKKKTINHATTNVEVILKLKNDGKVIRLREKYTIDIYFRNSKICRAVHTFTSEKLADDDKGIIEKDHE